MKMTESNKTIGFSSQMLRSRAARAPPIANSLDPIRTCQCQAEDRLRRVIDRLEDGHRVMKYQSLKYQKLCLE